MQVRVCVMLKVRDERGTRYVYRLGSSAAGVEQWYGNPLEYVE
jgi:hypothetical protein